MKNPSTIGLDFAILIQRHCFVLFFLDDGDIPRFQSDVLSMR